MIWFSGLSVPGYLQIDFSQSVRVRNVLAEGGFGTVSIADALNPMLKQYGDHVIVKQLKQSKLSDHSIQLFNQEIALMEYFKGEKHIAKLLGYSIDPFCLVMKYYPTGSLTRVIRDTKNRCKIHVITFLRDIANGLWAMQIKGVVHNDVKSDNVLVDTSPTTGQPFCVLSDLGISQIVTQAILKVGEFKVAEIRALSMAYAAPERIYCFRHKVHLSSYDQQTVFSWDVYSLGIVMLEILTGKTKLY
jgi:eukaryotic-like serine/threonine-protein kinase